MGEKPDGKELALQQLLPFRVYNWCEPLSQKQHGGQVSLVRAQERSVYCPHSPTLLTMKTYESIHLVTGNLRDSL